MSSFSCETCYLWILLWLQWVQDDRNLCSLWRTNLFFFILEKCSFGGISLDEVNGAAQFFHFSLTSQRKWLFPKMFYFYYNSACFEKHTQDNSNLYVALTWLEAGAQYFLWQIIAGLGTFSFFAHLKKKRRNLIPLRYKWVWYNGANWELSVLRRGLTCSQPVFQRASLCQTERPRVRSLPETRAVWLSSCYWLLFSFLFFLQRADFCQVNFFLSQLSEHRLHRTPQPSTQGSTNAFNSKQSFVIQWQACNIW